MPLIAKTTKNDDGLTKSFKCCYCGVWNELSIYVYAHWEIPLEHECRCGATHQIFRGLVTLDSEPSDGD